MPNKIPMLKSIVDPFKVDADGQTTTLADIICDNMHKIHVANIGTVKFVTFDDSGKGFRLSSKCAKELEYVINPPPPTDVEKVGGKLKRIHLPLLLAILNKHSDEYHILSQNIRTKHQAIELAIRYIKIGATIAIGPGKTWAVVRKIPTT